MNPLPDEAYYWVWSKRVALSYFDHPPLTTWIQSLLSYLSNNKYLLIRALPLFCLIVVLSILIFWQSYIIKNLNHLDRLRSVILFLAFPIHVIFFSISFPDYLLITLLFSSGFCLFLYFKKNSDGGNGIVLWYISVILFSLAVLTKYNAVLFGLGILLYLLFYKDKIRGPKYGHLIASTGIFLLIQWPVLWWNINNDFASFAFHLGERLDKEKDFLVISQNISVFLIGVILAFSPVFIFNLWRNFFFDNYRNELKIFITMSKFTLLLCIVFCLLLSTFTNVLYYWFVPGIILVIPFLLNIVRSKIWQYLHISYGVIISVILLVNSGVHPISALWGDVDRETAIVFGWENITDAVKDEKKLHGIEKVLFSDYRLGSLYIFHSGDFQVDVFMEDRRTQFDIWRDNENAVLENALIVTDKDFPLNQKILSNFKFIKPVRNVEIYVGKQVIRKYQIFLGRTK